MSEFIALWSLIPLAYWLRRTWLLLGADDVRISAALERDSRWLRVFERG